MFGVGACQESQVLESHDEPFFGFLKKDYVNPGMRVECKMTYRDDSALRRDECCEHRTKNE